MRTRTTTLEVTNVTGEKLRTSVTQYPTPEDLICFLARAVVREKSYGKVAYVSPSESVRDSLFRFE